MYDGWLLKIGNYTVPLSLIAADTYKPKLIMQTLDPWTDVEGLLHFEGAEVHVAKVEFNLIPTTNTQFADFMSHVRSQYIEAKSRKVNITIYAPELDDYVTQLAYVADIEPQIYYADANKIQYDAMRISLIGGVAESD